MPSPPELVIDLIFGRWRSQILYAGAALGVFDHLGGDEAVGAAALAPMVGADPALLYRLMRALASIGLLAEDDRQGFRLTEAGMLLRDDHPHSLRAMALLVEGPEHYEVWKHLVPILRDGRQDGFVREFGMPLFEYARREREIWGDFQQSDDQLFRYSGAMGVGGTRDRGFHEHSHVLRRRRRPWLSCLRFSQSISRYLGDRVRPTGSHRRNRSPVGLQAQPRGPLPVSGR